MTSNTLVKEKLGLKIIPDKLLKVLRAGRPLNTSQSLVAGSSHPKPAGMPFDQYFHIVGE